MYELKLINKNNETYINISSTNINAPRCTGTIKQGINCINSFTITINAVNPHFFSDIIPLSTRVKVINKKNNKLEFDGRVLREGKIMSSSGEFTKTYICEDSLGFLRDSVLLYDEYQNISLKDYLQMCINEHNKQTEIYKHFNLGEIDNTIDSNDSLYRYTSYDSIWNNIKNDLLDKLSGEIQVRYENGIRYIDYIRERGKKSNTQIILGYNLKDIESNVDMSEFPTRIIPLGSKLKKIDSEGNEIDSEERLTIRSVNNNCNFLDYDEGLEIYGINTRFITYDDVNDASNLLQKAKEYIKSLKISISNSISALDLSLLGLETDSFEVGNYHRIYHKILEIDYEIRIIEKEIDIANPQNSKLTFGEKRMSMQEQQANLMRVSANYKKLNNEVSSINKNIGNLNSNVTNVNDKVIKLEQRESDFATKKEVNNYVDKNNKTIDIINSRLEKLEGSANV